MEKELSKAANVLKSGLNDTKENMKKLIGKDKQNSRITSQSNFHEGNQSLANSLDFKNSPSALLKRSSDVPSDTVDSSILSEVTTVISTKNGESSNLHGIISPFDSLNSDNDSDIEHPHHHLSTSSSASTNILMDNNSKAVGNIQVSQV
jgi:hypothetical protein